MTLTAFSIASKQLSVLLSNFRESFHNSVGIQNPSVQSSKDSVERSMFLQIVPTCRKNEHFSMGRPIINFPDIIPNHRKNCTLLRIFTRLSGVQPVLMHLHFMIKWKVSDSYIIGTLEVVRKTEPIDEL